MALRRGSISIDGAQGTLPAAASHATLLAHWASMRALESPMEKMTRRLVLGAMLAVAGIASAADPGEWSYSGEHGPDNWARLAPEFGACAGKNQSPIDLTGFIDAHLNPITTAYRAGGTGIINNGHTVQVDYDAGSSITVEGIAFTLKQFHFHAPSENHVAGRAYPMEAHLVHADKDGNLLVLAVMIKEGVANKALAEFWPAIPKNAGESAPLPRPFLAARLLPADHHYYRFNGSLTTPPCSEGVRWLVLKAPVSASKEQIEAFEHVMHHPNNRPLQAVNARPVLR
jgi:carbonic anhydrase